MGIHATAASRFLARGPALLLALFASACFSLDYDLSSIPIPLSASAADPTQGEIEPFRIEARNVLWMDGLFGHEQPDVAALVAEQARGCDAVANFRVSHETNFHQWLLTHLSLTLVRMKTVVISGELLRRPQPGDREAALATVQAFFDAMHTRDVEAAARTVVPDGVFVHTRTEDGKRVERHFTNREFVENLSREKTVLLEELTGKPVVLVDGDVAVVWAPYRFEVDGKPSHTGVDAFNLIRTAAGWRISGGAYSVIRPSPLP